MPRAEDHDVLEDTFESFGNTMRASFAQKASFALMQRLSVAGVATNLKQGTVMGVVLNTLCNVMGAGILSLPLAMYNASIVLGGVLLVLSSILSAFASYFVACGCDATGRESFAEVLAFSIWPEKSPPREFGGRTGDASADLSEDPNRHERELSAYLAEEARKRRNRRRTLVVLEIIIFLNNFGALVIYSRVIADSIPPVIQNFLNGDGIWTDKITWFLISGAMFFPLSCVRSMEELKWTSLVGFVTILYVVIVIIVRFFTLASERPPSDEIHYTHVTTNALKAMSAYGVAWSYHYNVPYFYKELRDGTPRKLMMSVAIAFPIIMLSYGVTGILGYITFGDAITLHGGDVINNYANDDAAVNIGRLGLFFHFACVFPVLSVCARRGLHRLFMIALQEVAGIDLMRHVRALSSLIRQDPSERDPLLPKEVTEVEIEGASGGGAAEGGAAREGGADADPVPVEADDDPGRPEDTTRFAIVLEAAIIVSASVFLAVIVSGIDFVIDIIGTLFGLTLMLIVPGLIGIKTYAYTIEETLEATTVNPSGGGRAFSYFTSVGANRSFQQISPVMATMSRVLVGLGCVLVVSGTVMMIVNGAT